MSTIQLLAEWAVRSSVLILAGAVVLLALRVKDSSIRLAAWLALLCGSLAIPLMSVMLPSVPVTVVRQMVRPVEATVAIFDDASDAVVSTREAGATPHVPFDWARAGLVLYFVIMVALILRIAIGLAMSRRLQAGSRETEEPGVRESDDVAAPVTLGMFRPVSVLPAEWHEWDGAKLAAVLAHERSHIARFDPAVQLLSAVHRTVLWFSPASWLLHSRIVRVAEEASDDAAVAVTRDRASYAEFLLEFMRCEECGAGVPMARYGAPERRIYRILDGKSLSRGVTRWSAAAIVMLGVPLAYLAASVRESIPPTLPLTAPVIAQVKVQPTVEERPKFDVASIRPCDPNYVPAGGRGGAPKDRFRRNCVTVASLISDAYIRFADGQDRSPMMTTLTQIDGGPGWLSSDLYTIEAETDRPVGFSAMAGPMMQTLLENRFQLRLHREMREGPVYELILAKSGASRTLAAKGTPCVAADFVNAPVPFRPGDDTPCKMSWILGKGPNVALTSRGADMEEVTQHLAWATGRMVIDKTGITGNVDLDLVYAPNANAPGPAVTTSAGGAPVAEDPVGPSIFAALERVGLKLEAAKGWREHLVIDSVSRPSAN
jgi:uncharacterized protein (TIGR03435 family)